MVLKVDKINKIRYSLGKIQETGPGKSDDHINRVLCVVHFRKRNPFPKLLKRFSIAAVVDEDYPMMLFQNSNRFIIARNNHHLTCTTWKAHISYMGLNRN